MLIFGELKCDTRHKKSCYCDFMSTDAISLQVHTVLTQVLSSYATFSLLYEIDGSSKKNVGDSDLPESGILPGVVIFTGPTRECGYDRRSSGRG